MGTLTIATSLALLGATCVMAEERSTITMKTFSVVSKIAPPPWATGRDFGELFRDEGTTTSGHKFFIWEAIPSGEKFDNWTRLYAITAENPSNGEIDDYVNGQINRFSEACSDVAVQFSETTPPNQKIFIVYCEAYKDRPELGEVAFLNMQLVNQTLVKNYLHIRGPKFQIRNASHAPFPMEQMRDAIYRVGQLKLMPLPD